MKIGFFDSGVGGLTVLHRALREMPYADFIYFADIENVPYGEKSKQEVHELVFAAIDYLVKQKVDAIVIACNTATSVAIHELRATYSLPVLGMEPAIKPAVDHCRATNRKVLVLATSLTLRAEKFHELVQKLGAFDMVDTIPLPGLVQLAEQSDFSSPEVVTYLTKQFQNIDLSPYGAVVLGCTHFPFYLEYIKSFFPPDTQYFDGGIGTVNHLKQLLENKQIPMHKKGTTKFVITGGKPGEKKLFERVLAVLNS